MWIKNFTPAGFVGYVVTNYGYDKLMQLAEGNIEQGKKHLTQFFVNHDQDITQEQATYLANFTMNLLTDVGGRILFHQVAAQGFQKVGRKGKKKSEAKKKPEGKPKQERAAEKQSKEQRGKKQDAKKAKGQEKQTKEQQGKQQDAAKSLQQALPNKDAFLKSADTAWKGGTQGTLSVAGRALQKHAGRAGSAFSDVQFSGKTANQDAMRLIKQIMDAPNKRIAPQENGTTIIYDMAIGRGFGISRKGLFNGFRNMK